MSGSSKEKSLSKTGKVRTMLARKNNPNTTILQIVEILLKTTDIFAYTSR